MSKSDPLAAVSLPELTSYSNFTSPFPRKLGFISDNGKIEVQSALLTAILYDRPEIKRALTPQRVLWESISSEAATSSLQENAPNQ